MARLLPSAVLLLPLLGCTLSDRVVVPQKPTDEKRPGDPKERPEKQGEGLTGRYLGLHEVAGQATARVEFDDVLEDGTRMGGFYDPATGEFDVLYTLEDDDVLTIRDTGRLHLDDAGRETGGEYREVIVHEDGDRFVMDYEYVVKDGRILLEGDGPGGDRVESVITFHEDREEVVEEWSEAGVYELHNEEIWFEDGRVHQESVFDDLETRVSPDQVSTWDFEPDGSGVGREEEWEEDGTHTVMDLTVQADGLERVRYTVDEPKTRVSPDIEGIWTETPDGSGTNTYTETYDDHTWLTVAEVYRADGSSDVEYTWEDPTTEVSPDMVGEFHYEPDGSGEGQETTWFDDDEPVTCWFEVDRRGRVDEKDCEPGEPKDG